MKPNDVNVQTSREGICNIKCEHFYFDMCALFSTSSHQRLLILLFCLNQSSGVAESKFLGLLKRTDSESFACGEGGKGRV